LLALQYEGVDVVMLAKAAPGTFSPHQNFPSAFRVWAYGWGVSPITPGTPIFKIVLVLVYTYPFTHAFTYDRYTCSYISLSRKPYKRNTHNPTHDVLTFRNNMENVAVIQM
jgi:hypothetical protein